MTATTTQTIRLMDCPACGKSIELHATYDVHPNEGIGIRATAKVVTATLTITGARVSHECPPPKTISFFTGGGRHPRSFITIDNTGDPIGLNP